MLSNEEYNTNNEVKILIRSKDIRRAIRDAMDIKRKPNWVRIVCLNMRDVLLDKKAKSSLRKKLNLLLSQGARITIILGSNPQRFDHKIRIIKQKYKEEFVEEEIKRCEHFKKNENEFYKDLVSRGARIYWNKRVHAKMILVESGNQRIVLIMSSSLTKTGLHRNYEIGIYFPNAKKLIFDNLNSYITHILQLSTTRPLVT